MGGNLFSGCTAPEAGITETPGAPIALPGKGIMANPVKDGQQTPATQ